MELISILIALNVRNENLGTFYRCQWN